MLFILTIHRAALAWMKKKCSLRNEKLTVEQTELQRLERKAEDKT